MLFNSYTFLLFFLIALLVSRGRLPWTLRKFVLLCMSYVFYAAWNPPFVLLLWISTVGDWFFAKWMHQTGTPSRKKLFLWGSLSLNLGMLGYFKYGGFVLENFTYAMQAMGIDWAPAAPSIILPMGISFYTFQTLSYTLDVYRGKAKPWHSFLDYALYVTFFPQLVAGPIVRASDFLPQCEKPRTASKKQLGWGLVLIIIGLFNKVVVADTMLAPVVQRVYDTPGAVSFFDAWGGTMAFAVQVFCDFSGYSTIAIGVALCLGFALPDNFKFPYSAVGFSDFWSRWHISLSSWLRDYLYIPLGGNRSGTIGVYRNVMVTMLIGGLWHGANWTFVAWGALHGGYLILERLLRRLIPASSFWTRWPTRLALTLLTFAAICVSWVFFRASSFPRAWVLLKGMFGHSEVAGRRIVPMHILGVVLLTLLLHWFMRERPLEHAFAAIPMWCRSVLLAGLSFLTFLCLTGGRDNAFIYFQF